MGLISPGDKALLWGVRELTTVARRPQTVLV
jgi:hypothetical protein